MQSLVWLYFDKKGNVTKKKTIRNTDFIYMQIVIVAFLLRRS